MHTHSNRLIHETSPYLLQHAHNPVDWYPWGEEALTRARKENKPILVSIGYAACHWCHVMERESFENEETARFMNTHFINIKIDREERPDLDHIYMDAVQAITGSGGWPLNVFLTPDAKPFYGGTYFPPVRAFNRASWNETLSGIWQAFTERRHEVDAQAENLTTHLTQANAFGRQPAADENGLFSRESMEAAAGNLLKTADTVWGGFGKAPKFPQTFSIRFLLRQFYFSGDQAGLQQALLSLDKMIAGGIYDQVGGGFARYSTDAEWLAPHFEKMLYDNALLVTTLADAWRITRNTRYTGVIRETLAFVREELLHPEGGFYAALDADSEGVEGKYYTWSLQEWKEVLGEDAGLLAAVYDIREEGNWEQVNIPWLRRNPEETAAEKGLSAEELNACIIRGRQKLKEARSVRIRPLLDDKVILGWNALMNQAFSAAFEVTADSGYRDLAIRNMEFLLQTFRDQEGNWYHTWKSGRARYPAFLDDLAYLVSALIRLQEITGEGRWLREAGDIMQYILTAFSEEEGPYFYYTPDNQQDVIVRKKEVYDGAQPSGNAVMAANLWYLSPIFEKPEWAERSRRMVGQLGNAIVRYPGSFGVWAAVLQEITEGTWEIVLGGDNPGALRTEILDRFIPNKLLLQTGPEWRGKALTAGRPETGKPTIYLCRNNTCLAPVFSAEELISLINKGHSG